MGGYVIERETAGREERRFEYLKKAFERIENDFVTKKVTFSKFQE
jgi:hypothetical protein